MNKAIFITSFDCEGKWAFSDMLTHYHNNNITNYNLIRTYKQLIVLLKKHEIKATFAFVGALTFSEKEYRENDELFSPRIFNGSNWLTTFLNQLKTGNTDGWFCPELLNIIRISNHEVATHGFSHVPFLEKNISLGDIKKELAAINIWRKIKGVNANTLIFPRNILGFKEELPGNGIIGYRVNKAYSKNGLKKACLLLNETNIFAPSQKKIINDKKDIVQIPGGYFLNWRFGYRRYIPISLTIKRWKNLIDHAVKHNGVIHLFSHPHNFINGKDQFLLFDLILRYASMRIKDGSMINLTQEEYCKKFIPPHPRVVSREKRNVHGEHVDDFYQSNNTNSRQDFLLQE